MLSPDTVGFSTCPGVKTSFATSVPRIPSRNSTVLGDQASVTAFALPSLAEFGCYLSNSSPFTNCVTYQDSPLPFHWSNVRGEPSTYAPLDTSIGPHNLLFQDASQDFRLDSDGYGSSCTSDTGSGFGSTKSLLGFVQSQMSDFESLDLDRARIESVASRGFQWKQLFEHGDGKESAPFPTFPEQHLLDPNPTQPSVDATPQFEHDDHGNLLEGPKPCGPDQSTSSHRRHINHRRHIKDASTDPPDATFLCAKCQKQYPRRHELKYV